jgi:wyosine [tRNA(Phe)-imidazoG37] synthetase (radical SAM superfamily)
MITFGPVPSRRLGKSLGINNIVSHKTCSYGCIYCQLGKTIRRSIRRETFYDPQDIFDKVQEHLGKLSSDNYPDFLTFVSSGEPTLDKNLGKTIRLLKTTGIPVAVISNASLVYDESVIDDLISADWVSLKVDAPETGTWTFINRPAEGLIFEDILAGIKRLRKMFSGVLCTETMLVSGINDSDEKIIALARIIKEINPAKAYLSVPVRPPAEKFVKIPAAEVLNACWQIFSRMEIESEFLTGFEGSNTGFTGNIYEDILNITSVHPLREDSILNLLRKDGASYSVVESLIRQRLIRSVNYEGNKYFLRNYHSKT